MQIILIKQKKLFRCSFREAMIIKRLSFQFIYENVLPFFSFVPWYFFDKTKGRFVTFFNCFYSRRAAEEKKSSTMWDFFYWKFSFVIFFRCLKWLAKLSQSRSWSEKFMENSKLWLFSVNLISWDGWKRFFLLRDHPAREVNWVTSEKSWKILGKSFITTENFSLFIFCISAKFFLQCFYDSIYKWNYRFSIPSRETSEHAVLFPFEFRYTPKILHLKKNSWILI